MEDVWDVVIIAGQVDKEARGLILDTLQRSVVARECCKVLEQTRKQRMEMVVPVGKHSKVGQTQQDLCGQLGILGDPEESFLFTDKFLTFPAVNNKKLHLTTVA